MPQPITGPAPSEGASAGEQPSDLKDLPPAAQRALAEAAERRRLARATQHGAPARELGGRNGPDPVRYGDWEKKGIAIDF